MPGKPSASASTAPLSPAASASAQASAATTGKPLTKVVEALSTHDVGYLPSIVAREKGYFADQGLQVDLPVMTSQSSIPH